MPSRIMVVHDDAGFTYALAKILGPEITWFLDPTEALSALRSAKATTVLITCVRSHNLQSSGLSLARLARRAIPNVRIILTGAPQYSGYALGMGLFLPEPVAPEQIDVLIESLKGPQGAES